MQTISPCLWYESGAKDAMEHYVNTFKASTLAKAAESNIETIQYYPEGVTEGPLAGMEGKVLTGIFNLAGQSFMCLDGGPLFKFTPAISLYVECETQEQIDHFWNAFSANPAAEQCGWLEDKFGVSWQIAPKRLGELMQDPDKEKVARVTTAFMQMKKFDIAALEAAANGDSAS